MLRSELGLANRTTWKQPHDDYFQIPRGEPQRAISPALFSGSDAVRNGVGVIGSVFTHREPTAGALACFGNAVGFARAEILPRVVTRDRKETPRRAFEMLEKDGAGRSVARCGCGTEIFFKLFAMPGSGAKNSNDINRA